MPPSQSKTVLVPFNLGPASNYDPTIFPIFKAKGPLEEGDLFLIATMREMAKIREMSKDTCDYRQLLKDIKLQYDELTEDKEALEMQQGSLNPFKRFAKYRKTRLFLMAVRSLYLKSRSTSEKMKRDLLSIASYPTPQNRDEDVLEDGHRLGEEDFEDTPQIKGLAIPIEGDLDAETRTLIEDAASIFNPKEFLGSTSSFTNTVPSTEGSSSSSNRFSSSSSGSGSTSIVNVTIVNTLNQSNATLSRCTVANSASEAATINVGGSGNSGALTIEASKIPLPSP